eukprot:COSAG05_NODE_5751_length_1098_cov_0.976977_2_plen_76_part_01
MRALRPHHVRACVCTVGPSDNVGVIVFNVSDLQNACMTDICLPFTCAHYGLHGLVSNTHLKPVVVRARRFGAKIK